MHKFFNVFPLTSNADMLAEAAKRVARIDALLAVSDQTLLMRVF